MTSLELNNQANFDASSIGSSMITFLKKWDDTCVAPWMTLTLENFAAIDSPPLHIAISIKCGHIIDCSFLSNYAITGMHCDERQQASLTPPPTMWSKQPTTSMRNCRSYADAAIMMITTSLIVVPSP